jgi:glycerol-3-phosphate dehydrogenase (NAD(P)+)
MEQITVLGAGAWGTTLAWMLAREGQSVRLWCLEEDLAEEMRRTRRNLRYRREIELPANLEICTDFGVALAGAEVVVSVVPSRWLRNVLTQAREHLASRPFLISATKGLEESTSRRMSQVLHEVLGEDWPLAVLSGPNLSKEIALGMPAMSVAAATDPELAARAQKLLSSPVFRVYRNYDIIGVELCGALKNVIAIGAGICEGLEFGANAKAALITRGLAEMGRLGTRLGAQAATFWGAAGVGDLVATANSHDSRNWNVGFDLAHGRTWEEIQHSTYSVAEGVYTAVAARQLGRELDLALPITEALCSILFEGMSVAEAVRGLMTRPERAENED